MTKTAGYTARVPLHWPRGYPRGPLGHVESPSSVAIGFCPRCHQNARRTSFVRGLFDCPRCVYVWYDSRVGEQTYTFDDFFEP